VGDYSRQEAAERAGVSVEELGRLVELGILQPANGDRFTRADVRKADLVESLVSGGLPLEGIAAVVRSGALPLDFINSPAYARFSDLSDVTFGQLSERTGAPLELLMAIRESTGGTPPSPDDRLRENELDMVPFVEVVSREGFGPAGIERILRVSGDSLRRMAETEAEWWRTEVILPSIAAGKTGAELSNVELTERLAPTIDPALVAGYHAQQARAWTASLIEGFEILMAQAGFQRRVEHPPAMCFLDISGYTRLTDERGDEAAAALAAELGRMVQRSSVQHGGKAVKWLGDGVMFWFRDPGLGVVAALDMAEGVVGAGLPPAHVGLHAGPVVMQGGDYYGQTVNVASRIAEYARPGEVLVSQAVVEASEEPGVTYTDIGQVELKGVGGPIHLHAARRR
jgi:class 3 adenylate cyclase/DNA-binding transcriptional MerR regulator